MSHVHWKLPIKYLWLLDIIIGLPILLFFIKISKPRTHQLTKYIKVLGKQNSFNTYAACIGCIEKIDKDEISKNTFTNKKPQKNWKQRRKENSVKSFELSVLVLSSKHLSSIGTNEITSSFIHKFTKKEISKFEHFLLRMTVANALSKRKTLPNYISSEHERLISKIKGLIEEINYLDIKLNAIVSDKYPEIIFLPCIANQCQLAIGNLFKTSSILRTASSKVIMISAFFKNANDSYFIGKLRDIQKEFYHKYYSIMVPAETCWNSYYFCFKSLIRSKQALCNLAIHNNESLCEILLNNDWWEAIECLQNILLPYCGILNKLQCDKARPFEILHALGYLVHFWKQYSDQDLDHYDYCWNFEDFHQKVEPFNDETFEQFGDDIFKFWRYVEDNFKELAAVALKIFSICINAASMKQMWSYMGFLHTIRHN
ncbi:hypothetical protein Glove_199g18 [Diversispora epigaea]|uniref:Uncharacterized protein n=1 Tax=Diversispora epigaea TaxID=1348612 RepID=A0A397IK17_9GLOM|nr:hypothetical protein Glove_199g18 [Diversispora epigaea]